MRFQNAPRIREGRESQVESPGDQGSMGAPVTSERLARKAEPALRAPQETEFLQRLGERVREARARRGMTRKILARDSGVSERYLAQLESGQGNSSVLVLKQIAQALNLPLAELVRDENGQSVELLGRRVCGMLDPGGRV